MPSKSPTQNHLPLFNLFAHQAVRYLGYAEDDLPRVWRPG